MLRSTSQQSYVCWQCLSRRTLTRRSFGACAGAGVAASRHGVIQRGLSTASPSRPNANFKICPVGAESGIRQRLRTWEAETVPTLPPLVEDVPSLLHANSNALSMTAVEHGFEADAKGDASWVLLDGEDLVSLSASASNLEAGDLLEVSTDSWRAQVLAVCLGRLDDTMHFYTDSGIWFTSTSVKTRFVVKNFITDPADLESVIREMPAIPVEEAKKLKAGPPRDAGAALLAKMREFHTTARRILQNNTAQLARLHTLFGDEERMLTLGEVAKQVLPLSVKVKGEYPPDALYAVHSALGQADIYFRPLDRPGRDPNYHSCLFVFTPPSDTNIAVKVGSAVRAYYENMAVGDQKVVEKRGLDKKGNRSQAAAPSQVDEFKAFLLQARRAVDQSRKSRQWSLSGMIGPSKRRSATPLSTGWEGIGLDIIQFIHQWAATCQFKSSSPLHWVGAAVLRAIDRYGEAEYLNPSVGWTFLQEIGWITPWDIHARHALRLPGVRLARAGGVLPWDQDAQPTRLAPDRLASLRRDFSGSTVYCIDSETAADIDDGVSIERADNGGYWIHVHIADPASRIAPETWPGVRASLIPQTIYLQGHFESMFKDDRVRQTFSLAPGRPSLTFSAKVNEAGDILDHKVSPGILGDVVYITPEDASTAAGEEASVHAAPSDVFEVGTPPPAPLPPTRKITKPDELSEAQVDDMRMLGKLAKALHEVRLRKGAMPAYLPRPVARVSFANVQVESLASGFVETQGDPYIRLSFSESSGSPLVHSLMQLAGQVAARWCQDRDIPVPYRVQPLAARNAEALDAFTRDVFYPQFIAGNRPSIEDFRTFRALAGGIELSATPGRNYIMGLDSYTKATSPLRRYCDLLVHWQIEAALLEEHRRGISLVTNSSLAKKLSRDKTEITNAGHEPTDESYLPFSKSDLQNRVFPSLRAREAHAKLVDNVEGNQEWMLQALVRAWRFRDSLQPLPSTFRFTATYVKSGRFVRGNLDWFDLHVTMEPQHLGSVALLADIQIGDGFVVELADVNVYEGTVSVKALSRA